MRKGAPRRWSLPPYTERELIAIEFRVKGATVTEIARRLETTYGAARAIIDRVYAKAGVHDVTELGEWANAHGLDEALEPEPPMPPKPKVRREKIKLGRIRRAGLG